MELVLPLFSAVFFTAFPAYNMLYVVLCILSYLPMPIIISVCRVHHLSVLFFLGICCLITSEFCGYDYWKNK